MCQLNRNTPKTSRGMFDMTPHHHQDGDTYLVILTRHEILGETLARPSAERFADKSSKIECDHDDGTGDDQVFSHDGPRRQLLGSSHDPTKETE